MTIFHSKEKILASKLFKIRLNLKAFFTPVKTLKNEKFKLKIKQIVKKNPDH